MSAYIFSELCSEAGLPAGVLNILHGKGIDIGPSLCSHPQVKAISFTGSTATGKSIAKICGENLKKVSLEMGGKNPVIVFDDCDPDLALETIMRSSFSNQGQICLCGSRVFIHQNIYEQFKTKLVEKTKQLKIGHPQESTTNIGPVVSQEHYQKIHTALELAKTEGARFLTGMENFDHSFQAQTGYFIAPTILEHLDFQTQTNCREIFGPVISLIPFTETDQVIHMANHGSYGLCASIWTEDQHKARVVSSQLQVGMVWLNTWSLRDLRTPFGGFKDSGFGREGGRYALEFFTQTRNISSPQPIIPIKT